MNLLQQSEMTIPDIVEFIKGGSLDKYQNHDLMVQTLIVKGLQLSLLEAKLKDAEATNYDIKSLRLNDDIIRSDVNNVVDLFLAEFAYSVRKKRKTITEKDYQNELVLNFGKYFPQYNIKAAEMKISQSDNDRIDIYAKCRTTHRDVIIEIKMGAKSAHKQLRSYAWEFDDPILINLSEKPVKTQREGIVYLTFDDIALQL